MRKVNIPLFFWRRLCQAGCLVLFLFLFIKTDYDGRDELSLAVNILFRIDPLLATAASLAARTVITLMLPALITVALTLVLGRFFCGWICPLGTLIDMSHRLLRPRTRRTYQSLRPLKYYLLVFLLISAFFGLPAAGYFDPFSILVRGLALSVYPAINVLATTFFTFTYQQAPDWVNVVTEPVYAALRYTVLPFRQNYFELALLSFFILLSVFVLERLERRFFCKNICPLGGLFALFAWFPLLRGYSGSKCGKCTNCQDVCRMDAIDGERNISAPACNLCMDCVALCPGNKISFRFGRPRAPKTSGPGLSRRAFISTAATGMALPFVLQTRTLTKRPDPYLVRPPGALPETEFLGRCVRCGECMKVCIGNALQPAFLQAGLEGMFSPRLQARNGYCEYNCTLCGQVCPSGAIRELSRKQKQAIKIGNAFFDKNRCLPYARAIPCIVCEEHCPTPEKAIQFREATVLNSRGKTVVVQQPFLKDELCIGCGICETKCPLPGSSAVRITSSGESRNPHNALPLQPPVQVYF